MSMVVRERAGSGNTARRWRMGFLMAASVTAIFTIAGCGTGIYENFADNVNCALYGNCGDCDDCDDNWCYDCDDWCYDCGWGGDWYGFDFGFGYYDDWYGPGDWGGYPPDWYW